MHGPDNKTPCKLELCYLQVALTSMELTGAEKYSPEGLADLEAYVDRQANGDEYSLDANLALLRLYQFSPASIKLPVLAKVLLKALAQLPRNDFHTCLMLVPERLMAEDTVKHLVALATALQTTRFTEFWAHAAQAKDLLKLVPGFEAAVRRHVMHVLGITFQRVSKKVLAAALNLDSAQLDTLIKEQVKAAGWQVSGDVVTLPRNELNSPVVIKRQEMIRFEQIAPVLRCATAGH